MRRTLLLALALAALLPIAAASGAYPPADAPRVAIGSTMLAHWGGDAPGAGDVESGRVGEVVRGETGALWFGADIDTTRGKNLTLLVEITSLDLGLPNVTLTLVLDSEYSNEWAYANATFETNDSTPSRASYRFNATLQEATQNGTVVLESVLVEGTVTIADGILPAPPAGLPTSWLVGGAAVVLVAVGAGAFAARSRSQRRKMRGTTRSQALREVELEERAAKRPEEAAVIQAEIRQQEKVKEKRRDLQILEAKRADVVKSIDLLTKRHQAGGLTKLQYDTMVAKRQQDLMRIEADIAAMEAEEERGGAAA